MEDVKMTDATPAVSPAPEEAAKAPTLSPEARLVLDIAADMKMVARAVSTKESRFVLRALRQSTAMRKRLTSSALRTIVATRFPASHASRALLLSHLPDSQMDTGAEAEANANAGARVERCEEALVFAEMLAVLRLVDSGARAQALEVARHTVHRLAAVDTAADALAARCWFCYARAAELNDSLPAIRSELMAAHRTATLRRLDETKATLLNAMLRGYLSQSLYEQADKLQAAAPIAEGSASAPQYARFLYYQGRIRAVQLDYAGAMSCLQQALRKAPHRSSARGFHLAVNKMLVIVQLLSGEIPERSTFSQKGMRKELAPYLRLAQAVRVGDLAAFRAAVEAHRATYLRDGILTLITRLRHNVIKAGLRKISVSYSRISLADVAAKLQLGGSVEDCEFIVAKAIRDGVINAVIDHEGGYMRSRGNLDIYATQQPHTAFHQRISFCLKLHNDAIRAMRFTEDAHKPKPLQEDPESKRDEEEALAEAEEGGMDDF
eukprot:m51a1_g9371 putative 26s proteasome non-atpase regulatory subunit 3-like (494) ;mRNA; r:193819-195953